MTTLYLVRCNYADPATERAWNAWYSGPKQDWLLSRPGFVAGQRFAAVSSTDGVLFAALYALESPRALETPEYQSGWGWAEWRPHIIDWTRTLFDGVQEEDFLTDASEQRLHMVFVGTTGDAAGARIAYPDATWLMSRPGLDDALQAVGIQRVGKNVPAPVSDLTDVETSAFQAISPPRSAPGE